MKQKTLKTKLEVLEWIHTRPFDTRMYALTRNGKRQLYRLAMRMKDETIILEMRTPQNP